MNTAGFVICDTVGGEVCVILFAWERMSIFLLCWTLLSFHSASNFYSFFFHFRIILSTINVNIKHVLLTRRIHRITELGSFKVTWILSSSDGVLMDDVCVARFDFVFGRGREVSLGVECSSYTMQSRKPSALRRSLRPFLLKKCDSAL